jgi:hypothetical protein
LILQKKKGPEPFGINCLVGGRATAGTAARLQQCCSL